MTQIFPRGGQRFDRLSVKGKGLARNPRYARLLARLPEDRLARLTSVAATFWEVYNWVSLSGDSGIFDSGLKVTEAERFGMRDPSKPLHLNELAFRDWRVGLARDFFGAIAFQMFLGKDGDGRSQPLDAISPGLRRKTLNSAFARLFDSGAYVDFLDRPLPTGQVWTDWEHLRGMNIHGLKHLLLTGDREEIRFSDVTTQAFFAAYWAVRRERKDQAMTRHWLISSANGDSAYAEFWDIALEFRDLECEAGEVDCPFVEATWESLFSPLYDGSLRDEQGRKIRSTELICRSEGKMRGTAAWQVFRSEFGEFLKGNCGVNEQKIAKGIVEGLISIPSQGFTQGAPADECPEWDAISGDQDNPQRWVELSAYYLHRYCVSNAEYGLFDARHKPEDFGGRIKKEELSKHPVANVNYWDASCFALWVGELNGADGTKLSYRLPTEAEWECACRAGSVKPFNWGKEGEAGVSDGNGVESSYCNIDGNDPWSRPGSGLTVRGGKYRKCTVRVDGIEEGGVQLPVNSLGFHQMHGNVWEWCRDWYERWVGAVDVTNPCGPEHGVRRVLRGGCWFYEGGLARSAYRNGWRPASRDVNQGFRLAAVPLEKQQRTEG
jgi:formylglycine-generating enzyme required for sulfatase activity